MLSRLSRALSAHTAHSGLWLPFRTLGSRRNRFLDDLDDSDDDDSLYEKKRRIINEDKDRGSKILERRFNIIVPKNALHVTAVKGSGPGGQNVNKVSTKADGRLKIDDCDWIPPEVKARLKEINEARLIKGHELRITSSEHRTLKDNIRSVYTKLQVLIDEASHFLVDKKPTSMPEYAKEKRILQKKRRSALKKMRQQRRDE